MNSHVLVYVRGMWVLQFKNISQNKGRTGHTPDGGYGIRNVYEPVPMFEIREHYGYARKLGSKYGYVKYSELSQFKNNYVCSVLLHRERFSKKFISH